MNVQTADLCDTYGDQLRVLDPIGLRHYGGVRHFAGEVVTLKVFEDNSLVRARLETPGQGRVLVVDGGASTRCALLGDQLASLGVEHGWAGIVIYGCIRDSAAIATMPLGVMALGTHPRKSVKKGAGEQDVPLRFAGTTMVPGDYLYADGDGIVLADHPLASV